MSVVRCAVGQTEQFKLHQGSALSHILVCCADGQEPLWTMMFVDDIVICSDSKRAGGGTAWRGEGLL